ncbi:hypothetical protein [Verminephrobacter eiseniae]|uniref:hypothetical protein n=1 Tax=Verminephrobacter eiseniae TaxID=364317 RepID=UPI00223897D3|nr:hypothetical protein [Verminephrobacter eiseniae]
MSTVSDILRSIEHRAERAIVQELHLMMEQIMKMRTSLVLEDRSYADALLLKLDRLRDDQVVRPVGASDVPPMPPCRRCRTSTSCSRSSRATMQCASMAASTATSGTWSLSRASHWPYSWRWINTRRIRPM